jgi:hypothetical protein
MLRNKKKEPPHPKGCGLISDITKVMIISEEIKRKNPPRLY